MTNREIRKAKQKLYKILNDENSNTKRWNQLVVLAKELNAPVPAGQHVQFPIDSINAITPNIHTVLQTEMMLDACVSAKRSCRWAAIAAIISLVGSVAAWIMVFVEFNIQT